MYQNHAHDYSLTLHAIGINAFTFYVFLVLLIFQFVVHAIIDILTV